MECTLKHYPLLNTPNLDASLECIFGISPVGEKYIEALRRSNAPLTLNFLDRAIGVVETANGIYDTFTHEYALPAAVYFEPSKKKIE